MHLCVCTVGSDASLSVVYVSLSVYDLTKDKTSLLFPIVLPYEMDLDPFKSSLTKKGSITSK